MTSAPAKAKSWLRAGALIALGFLSVAILVIGYGLAFPNTLKPLAESITERVLDRPLVIDGDLSLSISLKPVVSVSNATLGNAVGTHSPDMLTADFVRAQIDLAALFENRVHLLDLQIRGAELHLEDSVDGRPNWAFSESDDSDQENDTWSFMVQKLEVTDSRIHAAIGELAPIELTIPHLVESGDAEDHLNLQGHGEINGDPWKVDGRVGPLDEILAAGHVTIDMDLMVDDVEFSAEGSIGNVAMLAELDLGLAIYGPDASLLGKIFRMPESFANDVALEASVRPTADGHALGVTGHISDFEFKSTGTITDLAALDGWDGSAHISGPDLGVFGKALQVEGFPDGPFEIQGMLHLHGGDFDLEDVSVRTEDATLILNADFVQFPKREGAFGNFRLSGDDISQFRTLLGLPGLPKLPFEVTLALDPSAGEILKSTLSVGHHALSASGTVGEYPDFRGTDLEVEAAGQSLATLLAAFEIDQPLTGAYEATSRFLIDADGIGFQESSLELPGHTVHGDLRWPDPSRLDAFEFSGEVELTDLSETGIRFGVSGLPAFPLTSSATLTFEDGALRLDRSHTRIRSLEIKADGSLGRPGSFDGIDLSLEIAGPRMEELFVGALVSDEASIPFTLKTRLGRLEESLLLRSFELVAAGGTFSAEGTLSLSAGWAGTQLILNGTGNRLSELVPTFPDYYVPPDAPWALHAEIELPDANHLLVRQGRLEIGSVGMQLTGMLDLNDQSRTSLTFAASGDSIRDIGQIGQVPLPEDPFDIETELEGSLDTLKVRTLAARWGDSDLTGDGSVLLGDRPFVQLRGRSRVLDIYDLQHALFGAPEDIEPEDDAQRVFPDTPIPIESFAGFDGGLDIQVDRFRGQRSRLEDVILELDVQEGVLKLTRAAFRDENGYFNASALLRPEGDQVYLEFELFGEDADVGLLTSAEQPKETVPRYSLDVEIWGRGRTIAELAGNMNGKLLISSDGGNIDNSLVETLGGDFLSNVLETLNPFAMSEEFTRMDCLVFNAAIRDGKVKLAPGFVMRTDRLNMFVYGSANLESESLDLSLATQARRGIGISAATITNPYFKIGGTLAAPALALDPASAAVAASVATATAGLSIVVRGLFDRLMGSQNPCPKFLEFEQEVPGKPEGQSEPGDQPSQTSTSPSPVSSTEPGITRSRQGVSLSTAKPSDEAFSQPGMTLGS